MAVRLQRCLGTVGDLDGGQYTVETASGRPAIKCPTCGEIDELGGDHPIDKDGSVTRAWKCPTAVCPFFEWIELESWG